MDFKIPQTLNPLITIMQQKKYSLIDFKIPQTLNPLITIMQQKHIHTKCIQGKTNNLSSKFGNMIQLFTDFTSSVL